MSAITDALRRAGRQSPHAGPPVSRPKLTLSTARGQGALWLGLIVVLTGALAWMVWSRPAAPPKPESVARGDPATRPPPPTAAQAPAMPAPRAKQEDPAPSTAPAGAISEAGPERQDSASRRGGSPAGKPSPPAWPEVVPERTPVVPTPAPPTSAAQHLAEARTALEQGRDGDAIAGFRRALDQDPKLVDAHLGLGYVLLFRRQEVEEAGKEYKKAIKLDPKHKVAHNNLGVVLMKQGRFTLSTREFSAAIELDDKYVDAYYNMACAYARLDKTSLALSYLAKAARLQPDAIKWAQEDQDLKALRTRPEFQKLVPK